jgi:hypothetical protein
MVIVLTGVPSLVDQRTPPDELSKDYGSFSD